MEVVYLSDLLVYYLWIVAGTQETNEQFGNHQSELFFRMECTVVLSQFHSFLRIPKAMRIFPKIWGNLPFGNLTLSY